MAWQFLCVDGADAKRVFSMPNPGTYVIGTSHKHCDICLHDLYVARVHCQIDIGDDEIIIVTDLHPATGTFVNKRKIEKHPIGFGDIVRIGNTHLRLEPASEPDAEETAQEILVEEEEILQAEIIPDKSGPPPLVTPELLGELTGYTLGHYRLNELVGSSPFKAVFQTTDEKTGQTVCLKVLTPQFPASAQELKNFVTVMSRALHLRHDHLVTPFGAGRAGHYVWVAREYVDGKCLTQVLEKLKTGVKPKWRSGLRLLQEIGTVLDFIHHRNLVHGNITPHNILIRSTDKQAKLANLMFNQALAGSKLLEAAQAAKLAQDAPYMAPELCHDESNLDRLSDLYSLGAVVYARVTGRPPLQGKSTEETLKAIRTKEVPPPTRWNPDLPEELEEILLRLLAKHRQDRYPSAAALLTDVAAFAEELETVE